MLVFYSHHSGGSVEEGWERGKEERMLGPGEAFKSL